MRSRALSLPLRAATVGLVAWATIALLPSSAVGQMQRDPTLAPSVAQAAGGAGPGDKATPSAPMAVIVRDGRPYVVAGTRLLAQGQMLGEARIERISETEIWLREGKSLRKVQRYAGIQRTAVP